MKTYSSPVAHYNVSRYIAFSFALFFTAITFVKASDSPDIQASPDAPVVYPTDKVKDVRTEEPKDTVLFSENDRLVKMGLRFNYATEEFATNPEMIKALVWEEKIENSVEPSSTKLIKPFKYNANQEQELTANPTRSTINNNKSPRRSFLPTMPSKRTSSSIKASKSTLIDKVRKIDGKYYLDGRPLSKEMGVELGLMPASALLIEKNSPEIKAKSYNTTSNKLAVERATLASKPVDSKVKVVDGKWYYNGNEISLDDAEAMGFKVNRPPKSPAPLITTEEIVEETVLSPAKIDNNANSGLVEQQVLVNGMPMEEEKAKQILRKVGKEEILIDQTTSTLEAVPAYAEMDMEQPVVVEAPVIAEEVLVENEITATPAAELELEDSKAVVIDGVLYENGFPSKEELVEKNTTSIIAAEPASIAADEKTIRLEGQVLAEDISKKKELEEAMRLVESYETTTSTVADVEVPTSTSATPTASTYAATAAPKPFDIKMVDNRYYVNGTVASEAEVQLALKINRDPKHRALDIDRPGIVYRYNGADNRILKVMLTNMVDEPHPCHSHYNYSWNTSQIHSHKVDLSQIPEVMEFRLTSGRSNEFMMPCYGVVTSEFGPRRGRQHLGIDIDLETGDPVRSAFEGEVRISQYSRSYGYVVVVRHLNGLETYYAHLSKLSVRPGEKVKAGDVIGLGGNTGHSRGSHLHFEIRYKGHPINPREIINFNYKGLKSTTFVAGKSYFATKHYGNTNDHNHSHGHSHSSTTSKSSSSGRKYHTIRRGDTLSSLSKKYGTSVRKLCSINRISTRTTLKVGRKLRVR